MTDLFEVGIVSGTHGLKGEVKAVIVSEEEDRFEQLDHVLLWKDGRIRTLKIERVRYFKAQAILKFEGLDRIEDVEDMKGESLYIERENALPLASNEYYVPDLLGCTVYLEDGTVFGTVADILKTGANDVFEVARPEGRNVLIPSIGECIRAVEPEKKRIVVRLLDGLVD